MRDKPPDNVWVALIEQMKRDGLLEVHPDDVNKPWAEQRLRKTDLGEAHHKLLTERDRLN